MGRQTVRQLLTATHRVLAISTFRVEGASNRAASAQLPIWFAFTQPPPEFTPGSDQEYGNFAFVLLVGWSSCCQANYEDYVHDVLPREWTAPLCRLHERRARCRSGYATVNGKRVVNCATQPIAVYLPVANITAREMFLFTRALRSGKLIPKLLLAEATKPYRNSWV